MQFPESLPSFVLARTHQVGIEFKMRDLLAALDRPVEVYVPARTISRKVSRHCRRRVAYVQPAFPVYCFVLITCPLSFDTAFRACFRLRPVHITELRALEAAGAFNEPEMPVGLGFARGDVVLVAVGVFHERGIVADNVGEGRRVPVEFASGLKGRYAPHHVTRIDN